MGFKSLGGFRRSHGMWSFACSRFRGFKAQGLEQGLGVCYWVLVKGFSLSYHNEETILFTIAP